MFIIEFLAPAGILIPDRPVCNLVTIPTKLRFQCLQLRCRTMGPIHIALDYTNTAYINNTERNVKGTQLSPYRPSRHWKEVEVGTVQLYTYSPRRQKGGGGGRGGEVKPSQGKRPDNHCTVQEAGPGRVRKISSLTGVQTSRPSSP